MKKTFYITLFLLIIFFRNFGQTPATKLADTYYENLSYVKAIKEYKMLADIDPTAYILKRLGDSYYASLRMKEAAVTYAKLFTIYNLKEEDYIFKYAQSLKSISRFEEALYWMEKYQKLEKPNTEVNNVPPNELVSARKEKPRYNEEQKENNFNETLKEKFILENLYQLNTQFSDFGVTEYRNTILFSSPRKLREISTEVNEGNGGNYLDIYQVNKEDVGLKDRKKQFSKKVNEKFHESSISFSPNADVMYFTRNNFNYGDYKVDGKGYINLKIYKADYINGSWQNIMELPFCSDNYSVGHPTLSKDGKLLYFVSDMPGSFGATDLFVVDIKFDGTFGTPRNLGNTVNTKGREMFPFIADDNTLYFSSDGHTGMGNLDIFESKMINQQFQLPINLKAPFNSESDDFAFSINAKKNMGYLSSNRKGGKGDDDIYRFKKEFEEPEVCNQVVSGTVRNLKFQKYLPYSKLVVKDVNNKIIKETTADEFGRYSFQFPCNQTYVITASKEYYIPETKTFKTDKSLTIDLDLDIIDDFVFNNAKEIIIKINDIYFDYDQWDIRPDAARELDHIIEVMNKYPLMKITSTSHTDARGTDSYNESLSQKRADATVDYIIYRGIRPDRITGKGYGESRLTNKCVDNDWHTNRVYCSEKKHQANRRTAFVIANLDEVKTAAKN
ncbi:MAG: OmpA family protein [Polaribacter sp.]|nr:OmpA family protein [Polaribacter sp.]